MCRLQSLDINFHQRGRQLVRILHVGLQDISQPCECRRRLFCDSAQLLFLRIGEQNRTNAVHRDVGLQHHARIAPRLGLGLYPVLPDILEAHCRILYKAAVGTHRHVYHRIPVGNLLVFRCNENTGATLLRILGYVRHILSGQTVKVC